MDSKTKTQHLLKLLVGAAWIDGLIQTEERDYLRRMAEEKGLADDPEIQSLLSGLRPIQPSECYQWLADYLGENPTEQDYQNLLEAISALIYSDGDVQIQEAQLLTKIQHLDPASESHKTAFDKVLKTIQKLYRNAIAQ